MLEILLVLNLHQRNQIASDKIINWAIIFDYTFVGFFLLINSHDPA